MNLNIHHGNVTGDQFARVDVACLMERSRCSDGLLDGLFGPLDAPEWINKGRMVNVNSNGVDVQFQQFTLRSHK